MRAEPSRRLIGGQAAMQSNRVADPAMGGLKGALSRRVPAIIILLATGSAVVAITAATALPSRLPVPQASPSKNAAPLLNPVSRAPADARRQVEAGGPAARRFTGRVGENLTDSMSAAGVPERQGREYVAVLSRAIPLAQGLSVDDRFDLVVERRPDNSL